jgi:hypothetical protein
MSLVQLENNYNGSLFGLVKCINTAMWKRSRVHRQRGEGGNRYLPLPSECFEKQLN